MWKRERIMTIAATAQKPATLAQWWDAAGIGHVLRARLRLTSALILLSFVVCHLVSHIFLLVSIPLASRVLGFLMAFWWTETGAGVLAIALLMHFLNALWSIYVRRSLRLSRWEWAQITLGLAIVPLMIRHVVTTRIASEFLLASNDYNSVLLFHWVLAPGYPVFHIAAVMTVWVHASIGIHFWLRTKRWYPT
jgi:adenylate cyclase